MANREATLDVVRSTLFMVFAVATLASAYMGMVDGVRRGSAVDVGLCLVVPGYGVLLILWHDG